MTVRARRNKTKGTVTTLFTLTLFFVVVPVVGLAIDAGLLFAIKAKLQTSTDGAALAAARSLSRGLSLGTQQSSAVATAQKFFDANIQNGWLGLSSPVRDVTFPTAPPKTTIVQIETAVNANTYFMRIFGVTHVTLHARGAATRRDVNVEVVLDRSGSLANSSSCTPLKGAAISFIQSFVNGRDRLGLVTFGTTYRSDFDPANDFLSRGAGGDMVTMVNNISCVGGTNAAAAYWVAYQKLVALNEPGALNVILFFTDGEPNALHMPSLQIKSSSSCTNKTAKSGVVTPAGTAIWGVFLPGETGPPPAPNPDWRAVSGSSNCAYNSNFANVTSDVVSLAQAGAANEVDAYGNSLTGWKTVTRDASSRITLTATNVTNAGINALENAARRVRTDSAASGLWVITYCVGLGNAASSPPEMELLQRVANVPESPTFNSNQPVGMLAYADNANQLQAMFMQLASDILRLSM